MCSASDTPSEARAVIGEMVALVRQVDPQFFDRFGTAPLEELPEWKDFTPTKSNASAETFVRECDVRLNGRPSRLVDYSANAPRAMADADRALVGLPEPACADHSATD